jgi:hypothetical protein
MYAKEWAVRNQVVFDVDVCSYVLLKWVKAVKRGGFGKKLSGCERL